MSTAMIATAACHLHRLRWYPVSLWKEGFSPIISVSGDSVSTWKWRLGLVLYICLLITINSDQNKMMLRLSEHHFTLVSKSHNCKRMLR
jgi:hypothetical protein